MNLDLIAEAGAGHRHSLDTAQLIYRHAKAAGANAVKWQIYTGPTLAATDARRYWEHGKTETQRHLFDRTGTLDPKLWGDIFTAAKTFDIEAFATPFCREAVDLLETLNVRRYKIASGDITNLPLLRYVADTGKPVLLSTGASTLAEIDHALAALRYENVTLLACTLAYPTPIEDAQLARIQRLSSEYPGRPVGYSDHTREVETGAYAVMLGATTLEKHFTVDPGGDLPDDLIALARSDFAIYTRLARDAEAAKGDGRLSPVEIEYAARTGARRSAYAKRNLPAGHTVTEDDVVLLRPHVPQSLNPVGQKTGRLVEEGEPFTVANMSPTSVTV